MYDSASGVVTSLRATTRSTSRPTQPELVLAERARRTAPVGLGPDDDEALGLGLLLARLVDERRHPPDELAHALAGDRRDHRMLPADRVELVRLHRVGLGADDEPRALEQLGLVVAELVEQDPLLLGRATCRPSAARSTSRHSTRARSMWRRNWWPRPRPSLAPSISPGMSATTKSVSSSRLHDAEVRLERGERVVGDLRLGRRDDADQRALADVGEADERDVGHQLELELEPALLAVLALLGERGRAALVGQELGVAAAAAPAGGGEPAVAVVEQVGEHLAACTGR